MRVSKCLSALLFSLQGLLVSCGGGGGGGSGGSGGGSTPPVQNASPGGIWQGRDAQGSNILGLVAEDGRFQFVISDGAPYTQYWGTLTTNGSTLSGSNIQVAAGTTYFGSVAVTSGTIAARSSLNLTGNFTPAPGCAVSVCGTASTSTVALTFNNVYNQGGALSRIVGNWRDLETGQVVNINASGVVFAQETATGCVINGQVSTINTTYNAYSVSYTFSSCRFPYNIQNGTTATGLAFVDTSVSPNNIYFAGQYRVGNTAYTVYGYGPKT
jgi:hypothetical protein